MEKQLPSIVSVSKSVSLDTGDVEALSTMVNGTTGLVAVHILDNFDAHAENDLPSGMIASFSGDAVVDPHALPDKLFSVRSICKIGKRPDMPGGYSDSYFEDKQKQKAFQDSIKQYAEFPPTLDSTRSNATGKEVEEWDHELGGPDSFIAVMPMVPKSRRQQKVYYLVAQGTAPLVVENFKKLVARRKPTWGQLFNDPEWRRTIQWMQGIAERNVNRSLAVAANAFQVPIVMIEDMSAHAGEGGGKPYRAVPQWSQSLYNIGETFHEGKPTYSVYHAATPAKKCIQLEDKAFFVFESPYDGMIKFPITNTISVSALPTDIGRSKDAATTTTVVDTERLKGMYWDVAIGSEASKQQHHPDLHPEAFRTLDDSFKNCMKQAGWNSEHQIDHIVPITMKLWNGQLRRTKE